MNLTGRSYLLAALVGLLGIVAQWTTGPLPPAWRAAAVALVLALLYEWLSVRGTALKAARHGAGALPLGRRERLLVAFTGARRRPLQLVFAPALPEAIDAEPAPRHLTLPADDTVTVELAVRPLTLGRHLWPELPVRVRGPLGLGWWSQRVSLDTTLEVIPDLLRRAPRAAGSAERGGSPRQSAGAGRELYQLRAYRPGDPRHTVDWKASARSGTLITRVFGEDQHLEIVVLLDAGRTSATRLAGLSQLGHYVNVAARFVEHAAALEDQVGVVAVADQVLAMVPPQRGLPGVLGVRRVLGDLRSRPVETDLLQGALAVQRLVRHRALVLVLTDLYGQGLDGRLAQAVRLLQPRHLPVVVALAGADVAAMAERRAERWRDPFESLAAREFQAALHGTAAGLRRQGAQALVTGPGDLEQRVLSLYRQLRSQRRI